MARYILRRVGISIITLLLIVILLFLLERLMPGTPFNDEKLKPDTLYLLDEPENSMSPKLQLELFNILTELARYCGCQLVIATHSPFLLSLEGARVYDLDSEPVQVRPWQELENVRTYYEFFKSHEKEFNE